MIIEVNDSNISKIIQGSKLPVLLDFWATWCGPCKAIYPILEKLSEEQEGKVVFGKVNVEEQTAITGRYGIRSVPTLILLKDGEVVDQVVGNVSKDKILDLLKL